MSVVPSIIIILVEIKRFDGKKTPFERRVYIICCTTLSTTFYIIYMCIRCVVARHEDPINFAVYISAQSVQHYICLRQKLFL